MGETYKIIEKDGKKHLIEVDFFLEKLTMGIVEDFERGFVDDILLPMRKCRKIGTLSYWNMAQLYIVPKELIMTTNCQKY